MNMDFHRVVCMRTAISNEESVFIIKGSLAMEHRAFDRALPNVIKDKVMFTDCL